MPSKNSPSDGFERLQTPGDDLSPDVPGDETEGDPVAETLIVAQSNVTADGVMTEERLLELIRLDDEEDALDFKRTYDLGKHEDVIKCVKVVVAMANSGGGYIVLGVDEVNEADHRYAVVGCPESHLSQFDPTDIHSKLERFVEEPLDVRLRVHRPAAHGGVPIVLLFVPPTKTLPLTFKIQGQYPTTAPSGRIGSKIEFAGGDIWIRRGAACVKANARDWRRIRSDMRQAERGKWTEELLGVTPVIQRMDRVASLLERLLDSGGIAGATSRGAGSRLTTADYLLPPRQLAERIAEMIEDES